MPIRCALTVRCLAQLRRPSGVTVLMRGSSGALAPLLVVPLAAVSADGGRHHRDQPQPLVLERPLVDLALHEWELRLRVGLRGEGADRGEDVLAADPVLTHMSVVLSSVVTNTVWNGTRRAVAGRLSFCHPGQDPGTHHQPWMPWSRAALKVPPMNRSPARARVHRVSEMPNARAFWRPAPCEPPGTAGRVSGGRGRQLPRRDRRGPGSATGLPGGCRSPAGCRRAGSAGEAGRCGWRSLWSCGGRCRCGRSPHSVPVTPIGREVAQLMGWAPSPAPGASVAKSRVRSRSCR